MNKLPQEGFIPYSFDKKGPIVTHLCNEDDTIHFSSGDLLSLHTMMSKLEAYEKLSGQIVNKRCPIYYGRKKVVYFNNMMAKVFKRLHEWEEKMLSYGGKAVLVKYILQALPLHLLSVLQQKLF
ncbi:uncharacterized protein [Nicotiana tomentosiformis]|uniref:uncharacterized protein n=1 Tax=Nicotiana tomentosiformis TaxID=4098 RepID=UPI00388C752F